MRLFLIISAILSVVISGCSDDSFNFTYTCGDQPWLNLQPSDIYATPEAKAYAEIWKLAFQRRNDMSEEYFNSHIAVVDCQIKEKMVGPKRLREFWITFFCHIDWALIQLKNSFAVSLDGGCDSTTLDDVMAFVDNDDVHLICGATAHISWIKPVEHIATQDQIRKAVKKASPLLGLNVNNQTRLGSDGLLECDLWGTIDFEANKCIRARVRLVDADVSKPESTVCWME